MGCTACARGSSPARPRRARGAHLARLDEFGHRADRLLDGHLGVDPVLVVEVDVVHAEPPSEASHAFDVLGPAVDADRLPSSRRSLPNLVARTTRRACPR